MGRRLRRVPLDFNWPINKTWVGYINPHTWARVACASCDRSGYAPEAKLYNDQWYGNAPFDPVAYGATPLTIDHPQVQAYAQRNVERDPTYYAGPVAQAVQGEARRLFAHWQNQWCHHLIQADVEALVAEGRLPEFTRRPRTEEQALILEASKSYWMPAWNGYMPTADEINAWSLMGFGHDSINAWVCVEARCKREGVPLACPDCEGHGYTWPSPEAEKLCEEWENYDPPLGIGFQLWETTSEGSPITPVFQTLEDLCVYAAVYCSVSGDVKASAQKWREMLDDDFVAHVEDRADGGKNVFF